MSPVCAPYATTLALMLIAHAVAIVIKTAFRIGTTRLCVKTCDSSCLLSVRALLLP